ncbi:transmembrane channel-like protein 7 [Paramacrobiotus metropolitanus]|uniref:transmembrane channel-like protein 7 n=1 Tax=Paramacrobiotus metropolitanus TaxID=2943436 RepID=UPI002445ABE2|nr:transmembrane channel-like protein 7 [Paramacrobiotus metropolitanus]
MAVNIPLQPIRSGFINAYDHQQPPVNDRQDTGETYSAVSSIRSEAVSVPSLRYRGNDAMLNENYRSDEEDDMEELDEADAGKLPVEEVEERREIRHHVRLYGKRQCWAKYCWADPSSEAAHAHPLETLKQNRVKLMAQGDTEQMIRRGFVRRFTYSIADTGKRLMRTVNFYEPVYQRIQGYFGSGIASYVTLINRLLLISVTMFVLVGGLFIAPTIVNDFRYQHILQLNTSVHHASILEQEVLDIVARESGLAGAELNAQYLAKFASVDAVFLGQTQTEQYTTAAFQLLQGTGWLEASWLYLGQYVDRLEMLNKTRNSTFFEHRPAEALSLLKSYLDEGFHYRLPFAFLSSIVAGLLVSVVILIFSSASSLKESLKGRHARVNPFCEVAFGSWSHLLTVQTGVDNQKLTETSQLKILLGGSARRTVKVRTRNQLFVLYAIRAGVWLLVGGILAAFVWLLFEAISNWSSPEIIQTLEQKQANATSTDLLLEAEILVRNFIPSIIMAVFNFLMPFILGIMAQFEDYATVKVEIRITLIRTVLLRFASVAVLLVSLFAKLSLFDSKNDAVKVFAVNNTGASTDIPCFETYVGQQIYKVLLLDILIFLAVFFFLHLPRALLYKKTKIDMLRMEFDLTGNILSAIYVQCLYWMGVFFAPMLTVMALIHFFLRAVLAQVGLFMVYETPTKIHHSSGSDVFFTFVAMLAFFLSVGIIGFTMIKIQPSAVCGPLLFDVDYSTMYDYFMGTVDNYSGSFRWIFRYITSTVVLFPVLIVIAVILFYQIATSRAKANAVMILKKKIEETTAQKKFMERKIRQFQQENMK